MPIELAMLSNHLILCCPLLLLPSIFLSIGVFSNESAILMGFPGGTSGTRLPMQETLEIWVQSLGQEDPLEKGMTNHSSILAWRIPWTEEPGGLLSVGCQEADMTE